MCHSNHFDMFKQILGDPQTFLSHKKSLSALVLHKCGSLGTKCVAKKTDNAIVSTFTERDLDKNFYIFCFRSFAATDASICVVNLSCSKQRSKF